MPDGNYDPASDLNPVYEDAGKRYGIDPNLLRAQTRVESGNNPYAVSSAGAEGMSQFIPSTAAAEGLNDPYDPHESIPAQAKLLRENADNYGSMTHAIGAYHSGTGDPGQWGPMTNAYLDAMNDEYSRIKAQAPPPQQQQQQPSLTDQIGAARLAGYSDDEIAAQLMQSKTLAPKFDAARKAGYLDDDILQHYGLKVQPGTPLTSKQAVKQLPMAQTEGSEAPQPAGHAPISPQAPSGTPTTPAPTVAERAGNVWQAAKQAYQETPGFLTPMAQQWADAHGVGGDARVLGAALGAFNAVWSGAMETANQLGEAIGQPLLGRDAAAMIESAGMTGGPHSAIGESFRAAREGTPAAAQRPQTPQEAAPAAAGNPPSAAPPMGAPAPEAPVAQATPGRTLEEEALSELNPEWTKPGLRERPQYGPPAPVAAEAHQELEQIAKGAPGEAAPPEQEPTPPPESPAGVGAPSQATPPMAPREEPVAQPPPPPPTPLQERYAQVSAAEAERSQAEEEQKGTTENPPISQNQGTDPDLLIADTIAGRLATGRPLSAKEVQVAGDHFFGGKLSEGAYTRDRLYDAQELGVNRFIQSDPVRFDPTADRPLAKSQAIDLAQIKDKLPTQTVRAGEKDSHQQFSTPPDFAYAAAWAANLRPEDRVLEPSAGTGSLAVMAQNAKVAEVTANEISEKRSAMLSHLGVDRLTSEDARQIHNALPDEIKPSVVLMNPPFSAAPGRMGNKMVLGEGAAHVKAALDRLEPNGRLVAIVGRGMTMDAPAFRDWWKTIGNQYDVRANVGVGGKIYQKYGTNFGTRLLVIDKMPPSRQPIVGGEVGSAADLIDKLKDVRDDRPVEQLAGQPSGAALAPSGEGPVPGGHELPGATGVVGPGERPTGPAPEQPSPTGRQRRGTRGRPAPTERPEGGGYGEPVAADEPEREHAGTGEQPAVPIGPSEIPTGGRTAGGGDGVREDGSGQLDEPGVTPTPEIVVQSEKAVTDPNEKAITEAVYENYQPQRLKIPGAKEHPGALVQSAAMASVVPPEPTYAPKLPKAMVTSGKLSNAQLEAVVYAGQAHQQMLPDGSRRGFFIGDGTGVGKGREIAGIIADNMAQGRNKHIWISESQALINDAKRDWSGLGKDNNDIFNVSKAKPGEPIKAPRGIMFATYSTLRGAEKIRGEEAAPGEEATPKYSKGKTRVDQIADWFGKDYDGVVVFDEAHNLGNAMMTKGKRGTKDASQMALAGLELQQKLPNARVVYVSATGATEVSNLAYAERLGLWGQGTAFPNRSDFLAKISSGGMAAMELVARDMKALGHYTARNLSYDGVEYDRLQHTLSPDQRQIYDKLAEGWQLTLQHFDAALKVVAADDTGKVDPKAKSAAQSAFWGGHQRFFNQVITSMQMPSVLKAVERDVKEGRQAVLQLVNTNEASQERALERTNPDELEDLDMTPRDQLMQLVEKAYPTAQLEQYEDASGNLRMRPVTDSHGNPVHNKQMLAERDRLLDQLGSIRVPDGPLEMLLNHFGTDKVAEVTGRKQRVVRKPDEDGVMKTVVEKRTGDANVAETNAFQGGQKPILVFSQAGGTGRSYHADNDSPSAGARRSHYLVQPGWRADKAVQGFGRTHRTNQASAPIFHLVTTDLQGQRRFISSIARRLGQLGALTKGERRTGDQGLFGMKDNLESDEAVGALHQLFRDVNRGEVEGLSMDDLEKGMGLKLRDEQTGALRSDLPPMPQFLNRLLSLKIDQQNKVFNEFGDRFDTAIDRAAAAGTLDTGVETYKADKIEKKQDQVVYTDPSSGAETRHVQLQVHNKTNPMDFDTIARRQPQAYVQNNRSGRVYAAEKASSYTDKNGQIIDQHKLTGPNGYQFVDRHRVTGENWTKIDEDAHARELWNKEVAATPPYAQSDLHLITGAVLPIWDRLAGNPRIYRLQTDAGERMLGRVVPNSRIGETLDKLGAEKAKVAVEPGQIAQRILGGDQARLANDWSIKPSLVAGERRLELVGPDYRYDDELARAGVFKERIGYQTRYFIPTGDKAEGAIRDITQTRPIVQLGDEYGDKGGDSLYSFPGALFDPQAWKRAFGNAAPQANVENLRDKEGLSRKYAEVRAGFAPTSLRGAKPMEYALRQHTSESAQAWDIAAHRLEDAVRKLDKLGMQDQIATGDIHEHGGAQRDPELQAASAALRSVTDEWKTKIQGLGRGYLANAIDNYMAHIWANYPEWKAGGAQPTNQALALVRATGRNVRKIPLTGSANFLKQRFFPTQLEGINAGLVPISYNWARTGLVKIHEMQKFYQGTVLADRIKSQGLAHWVRDSDAREAMDRGEVPLDDKIFQPKLYGVTPIGPVEPGKWYSPEPAARVFNNYMSQGWANNFRIYDALRQMNNGLNNLQLGIGGFHAAFVTNDAAVSKAGLGLIQASRLELGEMARGAGNMLFGLPVVGHAASITDSLIKGGKVRSAWLDPQNAPPEMQPILRALNAGGFRMTMPSYFRTSAAGSFFKSWNDLKDPASAWHQAMQMFRDAPTPFQKAIATPIKIAHRALDTIMEPLMGAMVPRVKAGVMYDLAADFLRRNPTATPQELSSEMTKFQDSVDNRLGQMNYDNLFWNKTLKDLAFITTRSVGWNLGTFRELGGGVVDTPKFLADAARGRFPQLTTRMAYTLAMPVVTGMLGAVLTYMATGQGPQSMLDYFYPPTGTDTDQGVPDRRSIPGYMKDVFAFWHDPIQTVMNKTSPMVEAMNEIRQDFPHGRDYYGGVIWDPQRDRGPAQAYGDWLINQATPFSLRSWGRLQGEGAPALDQALGFFGFQPAPASITNPERGAQFQRKEMNRATKMREREVSKGLSMHIFNTPTGAAP